MSILENGLTYLKCLKISFKLLLKRKINWKLSIGIKYWRTKKINFSSKQWMVLKIILQKKFINLKFDFAPGKIFFILWSKWINTFTWAWLIHLPKKIFLLSHINHKSEYRFKKNRSDLKLIFDKKILNKKKNETAINNSNI